jgi:ribosomal protein L44E
MTVGKRQIRRADSAFGGSSYTRPHFNHGLSRRNQMKAEWTRRYTRMNTDFTND